MSRHPSLEGGCIVGGCPNGKATRLGVCREHWALLTPDLQTLWQDAWIRSGRVKHWLAVRRQCLRYLGDGAPTEIPF